MTAPHHPSGGPVRGLFGVSAAEAQATMRANAQALRDSQPTTAELARRLRLARTQEPSAADFQQAAEAIRRVGAQMAPLMATITRALRTTVQRFGAFLAGTTVELVVDDPFDRHPTTLRGLLAQVRDIALHEFWTHAERPERAPGARYIRRYPDGHTVTIAQGPFR